MKKGLDVLFKANITKLWSELFFLELFFHMRKSLVAIRPRDVHFCLVIWAVLTSLTHASWNLHGFSFMTFTTFKSFVTPCLTSRG